MLNQHPSSLHSKFLTGLLFLVFLIFVPSLPASETNEDAATAWAKGNFQAAIRILRTKAKKGDPIAQYNLGWAFQKGPTEVRDKEKSRYWFTRGAKRDDKYAQYKLIELLVDDGTTQKIVYKENGGICFSRQEDKEGKVVWRLCKGPVVEDTYQQLDQWLKAITKSPPEDLVNFLQGERQRFIPAAQLILGMLYERGEVLELDEARAVENYLTAATHGIPVAQTHLASLYESGNDIPRDYEEARIWYLEAANKGYREAQYRLGLFYISEESPIRDLEKALVWFYELERQGDSRAAIHLGRIYYERENFDKALDWFRKSEKNGDLLARYYIAEMTHFGLGTLKNLKATQRLLRQLAKSGAELIAIEEFAEDGQVFAQIALGYICSEGPEGRRDFKKALHFYRIAANQDDWFAQRKLGDFYSEGIEVSRDLLKAKMWYERAAAQRDKYSKFKVAEVEALIQQEVEDEKKRVAEEEERQKIAEDEKKKKEKEEEQQRIENKKVAAEEKIRECEEKWNYREKDEIINSGTGFVINHQGYAITNEHVIENCNAVRVKIGEDDLATIVVSKDPRNDLAILKTCHKFPSFATFRSRRKPVRQGEEIISYGFPIAGLLSLEPKINQGIVNALEVGDDYRKLQHSAPSHPGNSGGPLFDSTGAVIGVTQGTLGKEKADELNMVAQNINTGIKAFQVMEYLQSKDIEYFEAENGGAKDSVEVADIARKFTVLVLCFGQKKAIEDS